MEFAGPQMAGFGEMLFSSPIFLFLFLPVVLTVYLMLPGTKVKNLWLLLMSLAFYSWGQIDFILLLLASTLMNFGLGLWVDRSDSTLQRRLVIAVAVFVNIGVLVFFKYADFIIQTLNSVLILVGLGMVHTPHIPLPIGISFFTFHALSYVLDVYRRKWKAASDPKDVALYIFFFPQLIAGPILRWSAIGPQLLRRTISRDVFADGVRRFVGGLAKKTILANSVALPADQIFSLPAGELSAPVAWFGIVCYTLQIYFDFSGYSDMAVGMGKMFGFEFLENFQFPYTAQSIRDFWRRWHISLATWFRDYLYIPLGGNRISEVRTCLNLMIVFFLCGLWHGASLTFVAWGLYHGFFLVLERTRFGGLMTKLPRSLRHVYTMFVVMMGWVIFRTNTFTASGDFFHALFGLAPAHYAQSLACYTTNQVIWAIGFGVLFIGPLWNWLQTSFASLGRAVPAAARPFVQVLGSALEIILLVALLLISSAWLASGTYNPFIYFRF
ncbi:MAG: MBOAT family O-acyltransferase [Verrucomicrobiae bacterium]|nr:MBOAT family O-acyltransferase [Verrucomicrobiae bacterium]